jgi:hypothetical protein
MRIETRLGKNLSLRYFTSVNKETGPVAHWLARTASHYFTSDTCRLVGDSEDYPGNVSNGEGWGDTPEEAIENLIESMIKRRILALIEVKYDM